LIEESLADNSKLVPRIRIRRGDPRIDQVAYSNVDVEGNPLLNEENDFFDDADFYQQLLRISSTDKWKTVIIIIRFCS